MKKPLTQQIVDTYIRTSTFDFPTSVFVAAGLPEKRLIGQTMRNLSRLQKKICEEQPHEPIHRSASQLTNLENLSAYFQRIEQSKTTDENNPYCVLRYLLHDDPRVNRGGTLALVVLFNLLAQRVGVSDIGAYECDGYYFSRYSGKHAEYGLSYPVRPLTDNEHRKRMLNRKIVSNAGLVSAVALETTNNGPAAGNSYRRRRFEEYAKTFKSIDEVISRL